MSCVICFIIFLNYFPDFFHVFHCLVQYMVHYCFFIFFNGFRCFFSLFFQRCSFGFLVFFIVFFGFSIVFQVLSPVYIVLLNVFNCFNFNVFIVFSSEMFIAFPFFQALFSLYLIDFPGLYVSVCTSQCFHFLKVVHCLFVAGFLFSKRI